jgi:hypothetical protein
MIVWPRHIGLPDLFSCLVLCVVPHKVRLPLFIHDHRSVTGYPVNHSRRSSLLLRVFVVVVVVVGCFPSSLRRCCGNLSLLQVFNCLLTPKTKGASCPDRVSNRCVLRKANEPTDNRLNVPPNPCLGFLGKIICETEDELSTRAWSRCCCPSDAPSPPRQMRNCKIVPCSISASTN